MGLCFMFLRFPQSGVYGFRNAKCKQGKSMKQSPAFKANSHSFVNNFFRLFWNLQFHYRGHWSPISYINTFLALELHQTISMAVTWLSGSITFVRWLPCHHGMGRPQITDGGDALQTWRVAANILNKQCRTTEKGWSFSRKGVLFQLGDWAWG
jgi:hypothetical protein